MRCIFFVHLAFTLAAGTGRGPSLGGTHAAVGSIAIAVMYRNVGFSCLHVTREYQITCNYVTRNSDVMFTNVLPNVIYTKVLLLLCLHT